MKIQAIRGLSEPGRELGDGRRAGGGQHIDDFLSDGRDQRTELDG
jgi:hypothetical protein